jgi:hypothetical protein
MHAHISTKDAPLARSPSALSSGKFVVGISSDFVLDAATLKLKFPSFDLTPLRANPNIEIRVCDVSRHIPSKDAASFCCPSLMFPVPKRRNQGMLCAE